MSSSQPKARHPLLVQSPLTVSPAVPLPTGRDLLPFGFALAPTSLPPSILDADSADSAHNHAIADTALARARALAESEHARRAAAAAALDRAVENRRQAELAEMRRLAPGWLDSDTRLLVPEKKGGAGPAAETGTEAETRTDTRTDTGTETGTGLQTGTDPAAAAQWGAEQLEMAFGGNL